VPKLPPPGRPKNEDVRPREHLTPDEVDRLIAAAAKLGRHGARDALMLRMLSNHGLRVSELTGLRRDDLNLDDETMLVRRLKRGKPSTQPLDGQELRGLRRLLRDSPESVYVFVSERGSRFTRSALEKIIGRAGKEAGFPWKVHPHMLRHACGYKWGDRGKTTREIQDFLGHRNIQHTVRYTDVSPEKFKNWKD
jgi:type 1 fimbriae regulatory protein FimB/type 1 fimbriae regulatory protein FimE